jgi:CO/xanthine dehydrogenase FAD-binding subunit
LLRRAADAAAAQSQPIADVDGSVDYKRRMVGVYVRRALERALA